MPDPDNSRRMKFRKGGTVKDVDQESGVVTAYWSAFGNKDSDGDIIDQGAFSKTIQERGPEGSNRIKVLWQHNWMEPIGRPTKMVEDTHGLRAEFKVTDTRRGQDALKLYRDEVITEHSIGLDVINDKTVNEDRHLTEIKLWEGSPVTWGANPLTPTVDVRSEGGKEIAIDNLRKQVRQMRKAMASGISDELAGNIERQCHVWEAKLEAITQATRTKREAEEFTDDSTSQRAKELVQQASARLEALTSTEPPSGTQAESSREKTASLADLTRSLVSQLPESHARNRRKN